MATNTKRIPQVNMSKHTDTDMVEITDMDKLIRVVGISLFAVSAVCFTLAIRAFYAGDTDTGLFLGLVTFLGGIAAMVAMVNAVLNAFRLWQPGTKWVTQKRGPQVSVVFMMMAVAMGANFVGGVARGQAGSLLFAFTLVSALVGYAMVVHQGQLVKVSEEPFADTLTASETT